VKSTINKVVETEHNRAFCADLNWQIAYRVMALCDGERHCGHIAEEGGIWIAFDATHLSAEGTGFLELGAFSSAAAAKAAVEDSVLVSASQYGPGCRWRIRAEVFTGSGRESRQRSAEFKSRLSGTSAFSKQTTPEFPPERHSNWTV
jgi:hypothetical protein